MEAFSHAMTISFQEIQAFGLCSNHQAGYLPYKFKPLAFAPIAKTGYLLYQAFQIV